MSSEDYPRVFTRTGAACVVHEVTLPGRRHPIFIVVFGTSSKGFWSAPAALAFAKNVEDHDWDSAQLSAEENPDPDPEAEPEAPTPKP